LGYGETTLNKIINRLKKPQKQEPPFQHKPKKASEKDIIGLEGLLYSFARCCSPIPGEPIVGVVTRSKGVSIHRLDCRTLEDVPPERLIDIRWSGDNVNRTYSTTIRIETAEKLGLLKDIIGVVSDNNTNINSANVKSKGKVGIIELGIELDNIDTLRKVMTAIQSMPDVFSVKRIQTSHVQSNQNFTKKTSKNYKNKRKSS
jgi:(p)ppGpp synthase/HD superfamily hydrolase